MKPQITFLRRLVFVFALMCFSVNAQVGIGTTSPEGSLDIAGTNGGLVIPRANLTSISDMATFANPRGGNPSKGTIIYNLGATITEGFYYFNGSTWQMIMDVDSDEYLGSIDQTLSGNRTVNLNGNTLDFDVDNYGANAVTIDGNYLELSRDAGKTGDALFSTRGGMAFIIDNNDSNTNDSEYYSWGHDGASGSGSGDASYEELMRLDGTGLGLGTANPNYQMHVVESQSNLNIAKFEAPDFPIFGGFIIEDNDGANHTKFVISPGNIANNSGSAMAGVPWPNSNGEATVTFDLEGSTYDIYTFMEGVIRPGFDNLTTLGAANHRFTDIYLVNNPTVTSDIRLKDNIMETTYGLDTVMEITPVSYQLISDEENDVHLGFKAQQIQELIPEIVNTAEGTGMLSMAYAEMIPVLTKAIQELNQKLDNVIEQNASLRAENTAIRNLVAQQNLTALI